MHRPPNRQSTPPDVLLYTPEEAADLTGLTRHWLITNARAGAIPHRRFGRKIYRFTAEDLESINESAAQPVSAPASTK